jgi:ABC-2 type transport system permease protein
MSDLGLLFHQFRFENRSFWRNPAAAFFTIFFPLMFLVIFNVVFGNEDIASPTGETFSASNFFVPAILAFSVITATYTNVAMSMTFKRDDGQLKRVRGTPMPAWVYLGGRISHAVAMAFMLSVITIAFGAAFYGTEIPTTTLPALLVIHVVGSGAFAALGLAITGFIPNADAAPAVVNFSILPLLFLSDVFIKVEDPPVWMDWVGKIFPVKHISLALQTVFNPFEPGSGFEWDHIGAVALWGVIGVAIAVRFFTWEPRK